MQGPSGQNITQLLIRWTGGDPSAREQLAPLVFGELHRIAQRHVAHERRGHSLQPSALVNEAYLKLVNLRAIQWQDRAHFFAMSARIVRRILVDAARARASRKRGGAGQPLTLNELTLFLPQRLDVIALDDALRTLAAKDARKSRVVELRFFGGLSVDETAASLGVSRETVMRDWKLARAWLMRELTRGPASA